MIVIVGSLLRGARVLLEVADEHQADVFAQAIGAGRMGEAVMHEAHVPSLTIKLHRFHRLCNLRERLSQGWGALRTVALGGREERKEPVVTGGPEREAAAGGGAILEQHHRAELVAA